MVIETKGRKELFQRGADQQYTPQVALMVENPPANLGDVRDAVRYSGDTRDAGSVPGVGRSPIGEYGDPLQYFFLDSPMDRRAWRSTVCKVMKS